MCDGLLRMPMQMRVQNARAGACASELQGSRLAHVRDKHFSGGRITVQRLHAYQRLRARKAGPPQRPGA